jgi:hypothetical protein
LNGTPSHRHSVPVAELSHRCKSSNDSLTRVEFAAIVYLTLPAALFFVAYMRVQVWVPAVARITFALARCAKRLGSTLVHQSRFLGLYFWMISAATVFASGAFGLVHTNSDWIKHFAVFRFLIDNDSLVGIASGYDGGALRYYLGWYVVPALLTKIFSVQALSFLLGSWTTIGLYLFFLVASELTNRPRWRYALPLAFLLFSGSDALGTAITGFRMGPIYHIEWWSGWIEFGSHYTDITWAPQHALSAWLGMALALRLASNASSLVVIPMVTTAVILWSPFSAIGLTPLFLYVLWRNRKEFTWEVLFSALSMLVVLAAIARYLRAGTEDIPFDAVWNLRCLGQRPCYAFFGYLLFVALEVVPAILICQTITKWRDGMVWIASLSLLGMPFVSFGAFNDLNLHGSIPALALLSLTAWQGMARGTVWLRAAFAAVVIVGLPTPIQEIRRALWIKKGPTSTDTNFAYVFEHDAWLRSQYMIDKIPWIIRRPYTAPHARPEERGREVVDPTRHSHL